MASQKTHRSVLVITSTFWLLCTLSVPNLVESTYCLSLQYPRNSTQNPIPEATEPCSADEAKWWQNLRAAGGDAIATRVRKDERARKRSIEVYGQLMGNAEELLSKKELAQLNADIAASTEKFYGLMREGQEKLYRIPVPERRITPLYSGRPGYTEEARKKRIGGAVHVLAEFRADGTVGMVRIRTGLGYGLDEKAIESTQQIVFLPAIRDGAFVTTWSNLEVEFNIR